MATISKNTIPMLSRYEYAGLLAERAAEIADGKPITIQNPGTSNPKEIAELEFAAGKIPLKIKRKWPDGHFETWTTNELQFIKR